MKIFHLYDEHYRVSPDRGSVSTVIYNIAANTVEAGHDVTVLERRWSGLDREERLDGIDFKRFDLPIGSNQEGEEIPYREIKSPTGLVRMLGDRTHFAWKLRRYLSTVDFDVLHVHLPFTANVLIHIAPELRSKMVYTAHVGEEEFRFGISDSDDVPLPLKFFSPDIHLMKRVTTPVVLNQPLQDFLHQKGIETSLIPNGVDVSEFSVSDDVSGSIRSEYDEDVLVLFVGTITERKGVDTLLDAAETVSDATDASPRFVIVGNDTVDEEFAAAMRTRVDQSSLPVTFTGYIEYDRLRSLLAAADLFVLPSREEGSPMALNEALASGLPVIGSRVSGIPAQIQDGENGYLFEPGDDAELAEALSRLIEDPTTRERMGVRSRERAENTFSWSTITEDYLDLYEQVVAR